MSPGLSLSPLNSWTWLTQPGLCAGGLEQLLGGAGREVGPGLHHVRGLAPASGRHRPPRSSGARILGQSVRGGRARSLAIPCSHTGVKGPPEPADGGHEDLSGPGWGRQSRRAGSQGNALGQQRGAAARHRRRDRGPWFQSPQRRGPQARFFSTLASASSSENHWTAPRHGAPTFAARPACHRGAAGRGEGRTACRPHRHVQNPPQYGVYLLASGDGGLSSGEA